MRFAATCQSGLESLVRRECEKIGFHQITVHDRILFLEGEEMMLYQLLIGSRFANRIYLILAEEVVRDFDSLHRLARQIRYETFVARGTQMIFDAASSRSQLSHIPTIQSIVERGFLDSYGAYRGGSGVETHILTLIVDDRASILLDVTGDPLHKRGYRRSAGEAPIKESLAAALVAFSGWRYRQPLIDPCCGSGTIMIEAAMIARNIAPGLSRSYRIQDLPIYRADLMEQARREAEARIYPSGEYQIRGADIDPEMIRISRENARRAGVEQDITFVTMDMRQSLDSLSVETTVVTNPPYGNRLQSEDLDSLYQQLQSAISTHAGGYISSVGFDGRDGWSNKKLQNGGDECRFWYRKNQKK